ncbi:sugar phosphate isomerase/epimerase [Desulfonema ishimotonii]|uniref:Sugar phosphate isomerase/epimerase n=1 Tax=Desulfonema ishimotonii TaxID=45657 RepID=A0A401G495_9BACT|nr:cobamide remodeling phosphodiesterase CbiR [Desulfonema ishimotonii]GBC64034.1 sugar phosphate isomerase/epimerase [Desulfonema ishimotonii]
MTNPTPPEPYPPLPKSYKGAYPFKLGTTSFIYPDRYRPNVRMLGPFLDEIELLMFESAWPDSLPSEDEIDSLARLGRELGVTYNVHLPTDVSLTDPVPEARQQAAEILRTFIDRTAPLNPSACALHLPFDAPSREPEAVVRWQDQASNGLARLLPEKSSNRLIAVETLDYPFEWAGPVIEAFDLSVCMDIGHLLLYGFDARALFAEFLPRLSLIHLHGVRDGQDHIALDQLSPDHAALVTDLLRQFDGVVSLEVFAYKHLVPSLSFLAQCWNSQA